MYLPSYWKRDNSSWKRKSHPWLIKQKGALCDMFSREDPYFPLVCFLNYAADSASERHLRSRLLLLPSRSCTTLLCFGKDIKAGCRRGARIFAECCRGPRRFAFRCGCRWYYAITNWWKTKIREVGLYPVDSKKRIDTVQCSDTVMRPPQDYDGGARLPAEAEQGDPRAAPMMICARLAGRAIIRVVGRCEDAQENSQLGEPRNNQLGR